MYKCYYDEIADINNHHVDYSTSGKYHEDEDVDARSNQKHLED
jgi:hypothetical protein